MSSEIKYNIKTIINTGNHEIKDIIKIFNKKLAKVIIEMEKVKA